MNTQLYNPNKNLSEKMKSDFDKFYLSDEFKEKYIQPLYKNNKKVEVEELIRSDDLKLQIGVHCDAVLKLTNGNRILIDDKTRRWKYKDVSEWCIETVSNTTRQTDGWGYKVGVVICYGQVNEDETGLTGTPFCFKVSEQLKNDICRNKEYRDVSVPNELNGKIVYWTINKLVPREILEKFYP